jgi:cytochrome P450
MSGETMESSRTGRRLKWLAGGAVAGGLMLAARRAAGNADGRQEGPLAPSPPGAPLIGNLPEIRKDNALTFLRGYEALGDVVRYPIGPFDIYCLAHPDDVQHILQANHKNYQHPPFLNRKLGEIVGDGLTTIEGEHWRTMRRLSQQAFHRQVVSDYVELFTQTTAEMLDTWGPKVRSGEYVDMRKEMVHISLNSLARALFGADWSEQVAVMEPAVTIANQHADRRLLTAVDLPLWIPFPSYRRFLRARDAVDQIIYQLIRERRASATQGTDLTSLLVNAQDEETGATMTDVQARDQIMTFLMAGHETVSAGMSWVWYLLSTNPDCAARVVDEVEDVLDGRDPTVEDLPRLEYISRVIDESMRLYPPLFVLPRTPLQGEVIRGYYIPSGTTFIALCPYVTHRHKEFWDNPEGFDPDRFEPANVKQRHRFAYFPFGGGPRKCIGDQFGLIEMRVIVAMTVQRYRLELAPGFPVYPQPAISLRPRHGLLMRIRDREDIRAAA